MYQETGESPRSSPPTICGIVEKVVWIPIGVVGFTIITACRWRKGGTVLSFSQESDLQFSQAVERLAISRL